MRDKQVLLRERNKIMTDLCSILSYLLKHVVFFPHTYSDQNIFYKLFNKILSLSEKFFEQTIDHSELKELIGLLHILRAKQSAFFYIDITKRFKMMRT